MVTGAYFPELSGAGLQCRELVRHLRDAVDFTILTTTTDRTLPKHDERDCVPVHRVFVVPSRLGSKVKAIVRMAAILLQHRHQFAIVHLHGFSQKSILVMCVAWLTRKLAAAPGATGV